MKIPSPSICFVRRSAFDRSMDLDVSYPDTVFEHCFCCCGYFYCRLHNISITCKCISGTICSDKCSCCHTETEVEDQTNSFTQSQPVDSEATSPSTDLNIFLTKSIQLSYLPCIKCFRLPVSVSCPVYRNVNDEQCLWVCVSFVSLKYLLVARRPSNMRVNLRDGSAQTILRAATLRYKLQIKLSTSSIHIILTSGRPVPVLTL